MNSNGSEKRKQFRYQQMMEKQKEQAKQASFVGSDYQKNLACLIEWTHKELAKSKR